MFFDADNKKGEKTKNEETNCRGIYFVICRDKGLRASACFKSIVFTRFV
jgi:hypothetical protein